VLRVVFVLVFALAAATSLRAASITVDSTAPGFDPDACTLLNAMSAVYYRVPYGTCPAGSGVDEIELPAGATITLSDTAPNSFNSALPTVTSDLAIAGNGATLATSFEGCDPFVGPHMRFFSVLGGGRLQLRNLTLTNGCDASGDGGGAVFAYDATVVLDHATLTHNTSTSTGSAIRAEAATLEIVASTLSDNVVLYSDDSPAVDGGDVSVSASTFARNAGGGLAALNAEVVNSTFDGNTGGSAITVYANGKISFSTFVGNVPRALTLYDDSTNVLANDIIVQSPGGGPYPVCDLDPMFTGEADVELVGTSFADDESCGGIAPITRARLELAAAGEYGGPVATVPLHAGSVAIDAGSCSDAEGNPVTRDARGMPRPGGGCDPGAFEFTGEDLGPPAAVRFAPGGVLVSNLGFVAEFDRSGNERQRVYAPPLPFAYLCGVDAIGVAGFAAQEAGTYAGDLDFALFSAAADDWTVATAPARSTTYCGTVARAGSRAFLTVGGLSMAQDYYGVTVFDDGVLGDPIAEDLAVFDVVLGKDGRLYVLGEPLDTNASYVVRAYDPATLQPLGEFTVPGNPGNVDTVSIAVAANGDVYVGRRAAAIDRFDASGTLLQSTDCVVPGNATECQVVTNLRFSDDGLLFVGDYAGRVTILAPDFSSGSSFTAGYSDSATYVAPLPLDAIFAASFDP
jgi:hypothetical protein